MEQGVKEGSIGHLLGVLHTEAKGAPVRSMMSVANCMNQAIGRGRWHWEAGYMSPHYHKVRVSWREGEDWLCQEAWSDQGPDVAALLVYQTLGGVAEIPAKKRMEMPEPKAALPSQVQRQPAQHVSSAMPQVRYEGPKPWGDTDATPHVGPLHVPDPPEEAPWFGEEIAYWCKSKFPGMTWAQAIHMEMGNPGGRDQPLSYIKWCIQKREFKTPQDPTKVKPFMRAHDKFVGRGKAALIWFEKAMQQRQAGGEGPEGPEDPEEPDWGGFGDPGTQDTPF